MSFFESIPQPPPPEPVQPRRPPAWMRWDAVIPGSVPAEAVLIRTERVAVAIGSVRAYPNGFEFTAHIRLRSEDQADWPGRSDPFDRPRPRGTQGDGTQLRLGILYADGRRAATTGQHYRPRDDDNDGRLVLQRGSGSIFNEVMVLAHAAGGHYRVVSAVGDSLSPVPDPGWVDRHFSRGAAQEINSGRGPTPPDPVVQARRAFGFPPGTKAVNV